MSDFLEISVQPKEPKGENAEIIVAFLGEFPFDVFDQEDNTVKAYGPAIGFNEADMSAIAESISEFIEGEIQTRYIPKENWNELWETNYFEPVVIDKRVRLRATFQPADESVEFDLIIQPKMSFGTGHHSTTQLMMSLMLEDEGIFPGATVLDMGAGTGVLAVLAEKLGAANLDAVDIEAWAAENIAENAELNQCSKIEAHHGDATWLSSKPKMYDVVLANIHKQVLIQDAQQYKDKLKINGIIFLSGFYEADLVDISAHYLHLGFELSKSKILNNWCASLLRRKE